MTGADTGGTNIVPGSADENGDSHVELATLIKKHFYADDHLVHAEDPR